MIGTMVVSLPRLGVQVGPEDPDKKIQGVYHGGESREGEARVGVEDLTDGRNGVGSWNPQICTMVVSLPRLGARSDLKFLAVKYISPPCCIVKKFRSSTLKRIGHHGGFPSSPWGPGRT